MVVKHKKAIAMIELIFALVIIGIVLLSAPMLIQQSIKSGNVALEQEAIASIASQASIILSMSWDENNSNIPVGESPLLESNRIPFDFNETSVPKGLKGVNGRNSDNAGTLMEPTPLNNFGRDETNSSDTNESSYMDYDDVDDYDNTTTGLTIFSNAQITTSDIGEYVDTNISISTTVNYADDNVTLNVNTTVGAELNSTTILPLSNIKFIHLNLTSNSGIAELEKNITLEAFSCNIGTYVPLDGGEL